MSSSDESCIYVDTEYNSKQKKNDKSSESIIFVCETKNDSNSYFGDDEYDATSASETSSLLESPPDYTEQLIKLYAGEGSMLLNICEKKNCDEEVNILTEILSKFFE